MFPNCPVKTLVQRWRRDWRLECVGAHVSDKDAISFGTTFLFSLKLLGALQAEGSESMAEQIFDTSRLAKDQQSQIAASTAIGLNALKPMIHLQVSLLRLWADNIETLAQDYEKGVDAFSSAVERQSQQQRAA